MAKKKNQSRKLELTKKSVVESLKFQTHFGLKTMGCVEGSMWHEQAETEISFIEELDLTQDIMDLKSFVERVKKDLGTAPTPEKGDFCTSITAIALGIASVPVLDNMQMPISWQDQVAKKILTIYYSEDSRNAVVDWAKANGYNTSTYLGQPIVKFKHIFVIIERTRK